jgi:hypothetical protein
MKKQCKFKKKKKETKNLNERKMKIRENRVGNRK